MPTLVELRQQRGALVEQQRAILTKAEADKRELTVEERAEDDRLFAASERIKDEITRRERLDRTEAELRAIPEPVSRPTPDRATAAPPNDLRAVLARPEYRRLFGEHPDIETIPVEARAGLLARSSDAYAVAYRGFLRGGQAGAEQALATLPPEQRTTLQADQLISGGYLVPPLRWTAELIQAVDDQVFIRTLARTFTVTDAAGMGAPSLDTDVADADWTAELATGTEGAMAFGGRELRPHPLAKRMKVSNKLMRASAISPEGLVRDRLAYKFGVALEKAYMTGDGNQKPLGVFTASALGIPTTRDVATSNLQTAMTADGLIECKHSVKGQYWPRLRWVFHRDGIKNIRLLKDGNGQYLWQPGLSAALPDRILEVPYLMSEYAPNTFTAGLYVGIIGDFSNYWIVDALGMTIQRLVELYAATNETGFFGRMESDGAPVLAEAFARVTLAP